MDDTTVPRSSSLSAAGSHAGGVAKHIRVHSSWVIRDVLAGIAGSVVLVANIVSFGALIFPGQFSSGIPLAIWSMLIGGCVSGLWIALTTSLPPIATGIDSPTGAVLIVLSSIIGSSMIASGNAPETAVYAVMFVFSVATFLSGIIIYALGALRLARMFRFVPYFVVGGFLAATGWLLVSGGLQMTTSHRLGLELLSSWTPTEAIKLGSALAVLAILLATRRWIKWAASVPAALLVVWFVGALLLRVLDLSSPQDGWYFRSLGTLSTWSPFVVADLPHFHWRSTLTFVPEILAVTVVALISLVSKVSAIEVRRQHAGNLDCEFRSHGIASLVTAPIGGIISGMQTGTSRLLEQTGERGRASGVVCSAILGFVALANFDLSGLVPVPVIAGLVLFLGYSFFVDALRQPFLQRAWFDLVLSIAIMIVCVRYGYVAGVLFGIVGACLLFAISYARIGVIRRTATREKFSSDVDRSPEASRYLRERGAAIQLYWISGYIFFGCSEGVFDAITDSIETLPPHSVKYVVLDFELVSGADSSAIFSLTKLRNYCDKCGVALVYCSLSRRNFAALQQGGYFGGKSKHKAFADLNSALAWCEDELLAAADFGLASDVSDFDGWLEAQLGDAAIAADLIRYMERKDITEPRVIYNRGDPADTVDLVAAGALAIELTDPDGMIRRRRRVMTHTVVGEMGFFRRISRSATVCTEGPATLYSLSRAGFERMQRERPDLASAFYSFIICMLADRIEFTNREIVALSA
jgi:SulP family sulfate permease